MSNIELHLQNPDVGIESYISTQCQDLANRLVGKKAIFLDTRFWIHVRDAVSGSNSDPKMQQFAASLRAGVQNGILFCPITHTVFEEICGIGDPPRRMATAEIVQEFSTGIALLPELERIEAELEGVVSRTFYPEAAQLPRRVWTYLSCLYGNSYPVYDGIPADTALALQKAAFDHMWGVPISQAIEMDLHLYFNPKTENLAIADGINQQNAHYGNGLTSFDQALSDEIAGVADCGEPTFKRILLRLEAEEIGEVGLEEDDLGHVRRNLLRHILSTDNATKLPTLHTKAVIHALLRWEWRSRKLTGNDIPDFEHASAALGYCDAFFTEEKLARLITHQRRNLGNAYNCFVTSDLDRALEFTKGLSKA